MCDASERAADDGVFNSMCQSYAGIFYNADYANTGGTGARTTRVIYGSNEDMDLEIQGSNHIRITAVDDNVGTGRIRLAAEDEVHLHDGATAETDNEVSKFTTDGLEVFGQLIAANDGATSFRLRGACDGSTDDGTFDSTCQSYAGIFNNPVYANTGGDGSRTTRLVYGSNEDMDLEIQGSNHIRITAVDDNVGTGRIRLAAEDQVQLHIGVAAETDAAKYIIFDTGEDADPTIETNAGNLALIPAGGSVDLTGNLILTGTVDDVDIAALSTADALDYDELGDLLALGFVTGAHTVDTDTHLDQAGVEGLGFVTGAHTTDTDTQLDEEAVDAFVANNDYATTAAIGTGVTTSKVETSTTGGELLLQPTADSSGRVRFFRNTEGNPMVNFWGYDSTDLTQKYLSIWLWNNPVVTEAGTGTLRAIISSGGNTAGTRNALEIQSPDQVRITAVDSILQEGDVRIAADTNTAIHSRTTAETDAAKYILFDTVGDAAGANPTIETNAGNLALIPAGGSVDLTGNLVLTGTVDGVEVSELKSAFDQEVDDRIYEDDELQDMIDENAEDIVILQEDLATETTNRQTNESGQQVQIDSLENRALQNEDGLDIYLTQGWNTFKLPWFVLKTGTNQSVNGLDVNGNYSVKNVFTIGGIDGKYSYIAYYDGKSDEWLTYDVATGVGDFTEFPTDATSEDYDFHIYMTTGDRLSIPLAEELV